MAEGNLTGIAYNDVQSARHDGLYGYECKNRYGVVVHFSRLLSAQKSLGPPEEYRDHGDERQGVTRQRDVRVSYEQCLPDSEKK